LAKASPRGAWWYAIHSREASNFTYELANEAALGAQVARGLGEDPVRIAGYLEELRSDETLLSELSAGVRRSPNCDSEVRLGKRRLLYCMVRAARPRIVAETGVDAGLGSAVLLRALERNEEEGFAGRLLAFDIDRDAGWLVDADRHRERFVLRIGDTCDTLVETLAETGVDFLIHDSLKTYQHETFEFETALRYGKSDRLIVYSDDDSVSGALGEFCRRHHGRSETLEEQPLLHIWRGNSLGLCVLNSRG
jgi:predicted O-methyltransferase YrrM